MKAVERVAMTAEKMVEMWDVKTVATRVETWVPLKADAMVSKKAALSGFLRVYLRAASKVALKAATTDIYLAAWRAAKWASLEDEMVEKRAEKLVTYLVAL